MEPSLSCHPLVKCLIVGSVLLQFACGSSQQATVYIADGTQNTGPILSVSDTSVALSPLSVPAPDLGKGVYRMQPRSFPNDSITRVTLLTERTDSEAYLARAGLTVAGIVVGTVVGGAIGAKLAHEGGRDSMGLDAAAIPVGILGGVLGGFAGGEIGSSLTKDTVVFDPKIEIERDNLRAFVPEE